MLSRPPLAAAPRSPSILPTVRGATNPNISQANIGRTICNPHWSTRSIRPPASYTTGLKIRQLRQYGWSDQNPADYEEDHLISLEIGGHPRDPNNLWPEPWENKGARLAATGTGAESKDVVENRCHRAVCSGQISLAEAQQEIATDWRTACQ